jgi:hypothetical protein
MFRWCCALWIGDGGALEVEKTLKGCLYIVKNKYLE